MTIVPGSLVGDVALSFKGEPTIAPEADWTYGGDASIDIDYPLDFLLWQTKQNLKLCLLWQSTIRKKLFNKLSALSRDLL